MWLSFGEGSAQQALCASLICDGRPRQAVNPPPVCPMPGLVQDVATTDGGPSASLTRLCVVVESTGAMAGTWPGLRCARSPTVRCSAHDATANARLGLCMRALRGTRRVDIRTHVAVLLRSAINCVSASTGLLFERRPLLRHVDPQQIPTCTAARLLANRQSGKPLGDHACAGSGTRTLC